MPDNHPLVKERTISMTASEALERAMKGDDADAGLIVAIMYKALTGTIADVLDEYEHEPEQAVTALHNILNHLGNPDTPTLN